MNSREPDKMREAEAPIGDRIVIEVMNGPEDGRIVTCDKMPVSIGRATDNSVNLPYDHLISRHHARLIEAGGQIILCDLNSTNGTFVGSRRTHDKVPLERNKLFRVGATLLTIRSHGAESVP